MAEEYQDELTPTLEVPALAEPEIEGGPDERALRQEIVDSLYDLACRLFRSPSIAERALNRAVSTAATDVQTPDSLAALRIASARILYDAASTVQMTPTEFDLDSLEELRPEAAEWFGTNVGPVIWQTAADMPLDQYAALHLQVRMGLSPNEIADALGISHNFALVLLSRARRAYEEALTPPLVARVGAGACAFISDWAAEVRTPEEVAEAMPLVRDHLAEGCESCASMLSTLGPLADLFGGLAPLPAPERLATALIAQIERIRANPGVQPTPDATVAEASPAILPPAPAVPAQFSDLKDEDDEPSTLPEKIKLWLLERDIPIQAVSAAAGLVIIVVGIGVVLLLSRTNGPQPVETRPAFAGREAATPIIPTSIVPTTEPAVDATATPEPTTQVADSTSIPGPSIFRVGRPEGSVAVPATTSSDSARASEDRTRTGVPQFEVAAPVQEFDEASQFMSPVPWITATPQNLGASGPGTNGQLVILNPGGVRTSNEDRPQPRNNSNGDDAGSSATSNGPAVTRPAPPPPPPPTPPPPKLTVSTTSLTYAKGEAVKTVAITNSGEGQFTWRATPQQAWILVSPAAGSVSGPGSMQVRVDRELAGQGNKTGAIRITSDAGTSVINVSVQ
jgi:hypothetical protein